MYCNGPVRDGNDPPSPKKKNRILSEYKYTIGRLSWYTENGFYHNT